MTDEEAKTAIQKMIVSIGALSELAGVMRDSLMANGFTREEAVEICCEFILDTINNGGNNNES